jgi:hypothetical protein
LDQLVLSGCGDLLLEKKSNNADASGFLGELPTLLVSPFRKIERPQRSIAQENMNPKSLPLIDSALTAPYKSSRTHERRRKLALS